MQSLPVLYKYTERGQVQQWTINTDNDTFWTEEGIKDGVITKNKPTICTGKNIGRANETKPADQALLEAKAKWQKKKDAGYSEDIATSGKQFFQPMLAHSYDDYQEHVEKAFENGVRVFVQPKLDGLRGSNDGKAITSRNGKPYLSVPHILHKLYGVVLDGELYNHQFKDDFNKIVSLSKKQKPTIKELEESEKLIQHWVYDLPTNSGVFSERYDALAKMKLLGQLPKSVVIVPTWEVYSLDDIKEYHADFLGQGYEGTMIRIDAYYESKRSKNLLKFKDFKDDEYTIVDVEEGVGNRSGMVGRVTLKLKDGRQFGSNVKGNHDYLKEVLRDKKELIGKTATVKYFMLTPDGIPRFPFIIKINRESYE